MPKGYLIIVLHAHLPFVRHPEYNDSLEERWLYEAITETYIPLLSHFEKMVEDGVRFRVTMSMTPPLVSMLSDELLQNRYVRHIENLIDLGQREVERTRLQPEFNTTAQMYLRKFKECRRIFVEKHRRNLVQAFRRLQDAGCLEILTCGATHGFLPLLQTERGAVRAQVGVAVNNYKKHFGRAPRGFWLAECGYYPGLDEVLKEFGIRYFFVDTHGILFANRQPRYGVFAPLYSPGGVAVFGRDMESSKSVWSAREGYPGDYNYREFYRDVGFDLDFDYIKPYIHESGLRIFTGIKYYRITGRGLGHKEPYNEAAALEKAAEHAGNFMFNREKQVEHLAGIMDRPPLIVSPYDAELFGHWWYEGPDFLNFLFRKIHYDQENIKTITPSEYLQGFPRNQIATPSLSSWGYKGYCEVWLEGSNDWLYRHLHAAARCMIELANRHRRVEDTPLRADGLLERALKQAARELLLAQSSDWAFIMKTRTMVDYAVQRTKQHLLNFNTLYSQIMKNEMNEAYIADLEYRHNIFPEIDYTLYAD